MGKKPTANIIKQAAWGKDSKQLEIKNPPKPKILWPLSKDQKTLLGEDGILFYRRVGKVLFDHDVLNELSRGSFFHLCILWSRILRLNRVLIIEGEVIADKQGSLKRHPGVMIVQQAMSEFRNLAKEFGCTPGDLSRLGLNLRVKKDKLEQFLFGGGKNE